MLWEDFLMTTVRPYPADWLIDGGWGCISYLVRLDEDLKPWLVLGQNGGLKVEGDVEEEYAECVDGRSVEEGEGELESEGLPDAEGSDWDEEEEDGPDARGIGGILPHLRGLSLTYRR